MNTNKDKRIYVSPVIETILFDNEISLALESPPFPEGEFFSTLEGLNDLPLINDLPINGSF